MWLAFRPLLVRQSLWQISQASNLSTQSVVGPSESGSSLSPTRIDRPTHYVDQLETPLGPNDEVIHTHVKNRNPRNLEMMRIGYKPTGFQWERRNRNFWNKLELDITGKHTKARVIHWTGMRVCHASTQEWSIRKFLYNTTDAVALESIAKVIGQRCLQAGISHVFLELEEDDLLKERMNRFVDSVKDQGITVGEAPKYRQTEPHVRVYQFKKDIHPWAVIDDEK